MFKGYWNAIPMLMLIFTKILYSYTADYNYINNLLEAGGVIQLQPKEDGTPYEIDYSLGFYKDGTILNGSKGVIIKLVPSYKWAPFFTVTKSNCSIDNITFDADDSTGINPANHAITVDNTYGDCSGLTISNVVLKNHYGNGIKIRNTSNIKVLSCTIESVGVNGIAVSGQCSNIIISKCHIKNNRSQNNIYIIGEGNVGSSLVKIIDNMCDGAPDFGIEVGEVFTGYHNSIIVSNNIVQNATNVGIAFRSVNNGIISSNMLSNCGSNGYAGSGIYITGDHDVNENVTISSNTIKGRDGCFSGIYATNYKNVNIIGNTISNVARGICLESEYNNNPNGRTINSTAVQTNNITATSYGIRVSNSSGVYNINYGITLSNNIINNSQYGIEVSGEQRPYNFTITGNDINNTSSYGINLSSVKNSTISNNNLTDCGYNSIMLSSCNDIDVVTNIVNGDNVQAAYGENDCNRICYFGKNNESTLLTSTDPNFRLQGKQTSGIHSNRLSFFNYANEMFYLGQAYVGIRPDVSFYNTTGDGYLDFGTSNISRMLISPSGNIGIGTPFLSNNKVHIVGGSLSINPAGAAEHHAVGGISIIQGGSSFPWRALQMIPNNGNTNSLILQGSKDGGGNANWFTYGVMTDNTYRLNPGPDNATGSNFVMKNNGDIGIGTTSPGAKLDVGGKVMFSNLANPSSPATGVVIFFNGTNLVARRAGKTDVDLTQWF